MAERTLQAQYCIYRLTCPHKDELSLSSDGYCRQCEAWVDGVEVGNIQVWWEANGDVTVVADGYADRSGDVHDDAYFHAMELQRRLP